MAMNTTETLTDMITQHDGWMDGYDADFGLTDFVFLFFFE